MEAAADRAAEAATKPVPADGTVTTLAGGGSKGFADGVGAAAQFDLLRSPGGTVGRIRFHSTGRNFVEAAERGERAAASGTALGGGAGAFTPGTVAVARDAYVREWNIRMRAQSWRV